MKLLDLNNRAQVERAKLERISARVQTALVALLAAEGDLQELERNLSAEQIAAVLAEHTWPTPEAGKKLGTAQGHVRGAELALTAARAGLKAQGDIVEQLEGEIQSRRFEAFTVDLEGQRKETFKAMDVFMEAATKLDEIAIQHGIDSTLFGLHLFPPANVGDALADYPERTYRASFLTAAMVLGRQARARKAIRAV